MANPSVPTAFIGVIAAVFAASSILLNNLLSRAENVCGDEEVRKLKKSAFFSISAAFVLLAGGYALLSGFILNDSVPWSLLPYDSQKALYIGALCMVAAVSFPTFAASLVSWKIFLNLRE